MFLVCGLSQLSVTLAIGFKRSSLFGWIERWFEEQQRYNDGAYIAALLDSSVIKRGDTYWIHRGEGNSNLIYSKFDHRRDWDKGTVVDIDPKKR